MFHALVVIERLASSLLHFYSMKGTASDSVECKQGIYCDGVVVYLDWDHGVTKDIGIILTISCFLSVPKKSHYAFFSWSKLTESRLGASVVL